MKAVRTDTARMERVVGVAAGLCGIHCLLTPLLAVALPFLALSESLEWGLMLGSVSLGLGLVFLGPRRNRGLLLTGLVLGAVVWLSSLLGWLEPLPESATSAAGSLLFAGSLLWSTRACHSDSCDVCGESEGESS